MKSAALMPWPSGTRARVAPRPSRGGSGPVFFVFFRAMLCSRLAAMDLGALVEPLTAFFSEGIGKAIMDVLSVIYQVLFPANAPAATPQELPR